MSGHCVAAAAATASLRRSMFSPLPPLFRGEKGSFLSFGRGSRVSNHAAQRARKPRRVVPHTAPSFFAMSHSSSILPTGGMTSRRVIGGIHGTRRPRSRLVVCTPSEFRCSGSAPLMTYSSLIRFGERGSDRLACSSSASSRTSAPMPASSGRRSFGYRSLMPLPISAPYCAPTRSAPSAEQRFPIIESPGDRCITGSVL